MYADIVYIVLQMVRYNMHNARVCNIKVKTHVYCLTNVSGLACLNIVF